MITFKRDIWVFLAKEVPLTSKRFYYFEDCIFMKKVQFYENSLQDYVSALPKGNNTSFTQRHITHTLYTHNIYILFYRCNQSHCVFLQFRFLTFSTHPIRLCPSPSGNPIRHRPVMTSPSRTPARGRQAVVPGDHK